MAKMKQGLSIIDKDCSFEGTVHVGGKLIVAGTLKGKLTGHTVVTAEGSHVDAVARVRKLTIGGDFKGEVAVEEDLEILKTGILSGKATCRRIKLQAGGKLNGHVTPMEARQGGADSQQTGGEG